MTTNDRTEGCACSGACGPAIDRRDFVRLVGLGSTALATWGGLADVAGPFQPSDVVDHFVPADKKLDPQWVQSLFARGQQTWYSGDDQRTVGMPVGGIGAGQLYLTGDGRLVHWDLFNAHLRTGGGTYVSPTKPAVEVAQGFALHVRSGAQRIFRKLDREGFPAVRFRGEYPIGRVEYAATDCPVAVSLEAFSPFIPLNAPDSALPATILHFTLKNASAQPVEAALVGLLENVVKRACGEFVPCEPLNEILRSERMTMFLASVRTFPASRPKRQPIVLADFEGGAYGKWTVEGEAFGAAPATGTIGRQQPVSGFQGKGLVNTFIRGDKPQGKLTSPPFAIERRFLCFLIGGGKHAGQTCMNLLVDGKVLRTAVGKNNERLEWQSWRLDDLQGKQAQLEIVDQSSEGWGHVNVDQIELCDIPREALDLPPEQQPGFGSMGLAVLGDAQGVVATKVWTANQLSPRLVGPTATGPDDRFSADLDIPFSSTSYFPSPYCGALAKSVHIEPGAEAQITFVVAWHFPNRPQVGNYYATRFNNARAVAEYVAQHFERLASQTRLWRDTWYNSSLPYWLLDRLFAPTANLATSTCQWWANGRFWAWEGVGCCAGTCAHVWNYEHAMARLFPQLERTVREMQDFNPEAGFVADTGEVRFRGEKNKMWAGDSQAGTVLKAYREHQCSADNAFLKRNWPAIRKTLEFLFAQDTNADGLIEGLQHNTYDINFFGPNTMVGSLYLAALLAAEEMAHELGDEAFAATCHNIYESGRRQTMAQLFNGEYFVQKVDLQEHPKHQYADGCLADQLFGQGWAHQVGLGYVYPDDAVRKALASIWKYNWAPDIAPQNQAHPPQRWFAHPGEAGLFTCTWPKSRHLGPQSVLYRDEVWTGIEYQVAGHMAWEGMLTEALAICRGIHDRYHPARHNPYNEIECGDHYARALASYGVFLGLCGFEYHGPKGYLGFTPRLGPDQFRAAFTAAEGWGSLAQQRTPTSQRNAIDLKFGRLSLQTLALTVEQGKPVTHAVVRLAGKDLPHRMQQEGTRVVLQLADSATLTAGQRLEVELTCG